MVQFKIGTVVKLKSGSPVMTVVANRSEAIFDYCICLWWDCDDKIFLEKQFINDSLYAVSELKI